MEMVGLKQSLQLLEDNCLTVGEIVTDRHVSITKMMRVDYPWIKHVYDIWHVAKGTYRNTGILV